MTTAESDTHIAADELLSTLDERITRLVYEIYTTELWRNTMSSGTEPAFVREVMKELYLEIYGYQPQVITATISIIGRMPKADPKMIKTMLVHQAEEADHGEMALRDYVRLGGDEAEARARRSSPAAFAVASLWWGLCKMEDPFCYLGGLYMFEGLTPKVCQDAMQALEGQQFPGEAMEFLRFHATEDVKHANLVRHLLTDVANRYPGATESILYGLDCFMAVYPLPVWQTAYERAKQQYHSNSS